MRGRWKSLLLAAGLATALALVPGPSSGWQSGELEPGYWEPSRLPQMGTATYYAQGVMEYVVSYRFERAQILPCPECVGAVALLRAGDIGRKVWLQFPGSNEVAGPFLVVDCARRQDIPMLLDRNWAVDVSYELGQTWGMTRPLDGVIVWPDPGEVNNPPPRAEPTRYYIDPKDVLVTAPTPEGRAVEAVAPLPTRLPSARGMAPAYTTPAPQQPVSLTPTVTTPTPPGSGQPAVPAGPPDGAGGTGGGEAGAFFESDVSLARPGQELLLLAARPAAFLETPTPLPSATATATATPSPYPTPLLSATPVLDGGSGGWVASQPTPEPNLLQRVWHALLSLFGQ